jgi:hypothetical protein
VIQVLYSMILQFIWSFVTNVSNLLLYYYFLKHYYYYYYYYYYSQRRRSDIVGLRFLWQFFQQNDIKVGGCYGDKHLKKSQNVTEINNLICGLYKIKLLELGGNAIIIKIIIMLINYYISSLQMICHYARL